MTIGAFVVAFMAGFALDWCWGWYMLSVAEKKKLRSALASVACAVPSVAGITLYVNQPNVLPAYFAGVFCGTYAYLWVREQPKD